MSTLSYSSRIAEAVEMGLETLSKLGVDLPTTLSHAFIEMQIKTTQAMLEKRSVMELLNYRLMTDKKKIMAMKFLRRLYEVVQQVNPNLLVSDKSFNLDSNSLLMAMINGAFRLPAYHSS